MLNELAAWLNDQGLRTRNTRKLKNADGTITRGPRLFTNASVRVILHNVLYAGLVKHRDQLYPGAMSLPSPRRCSTLCRTSSVKTVADLRP